MPDKSQKLAILYGSQTGNAEDMAKRIGRQAKQLGHEVLVQAMDDYPLKSLPQQQLVIFVCSTTGHGQEPENMKSLYNFIRRRDLPKDCLRDVKFAIYGLGDSSYAKFNYVSKILFKRLAECGGQPLQELVASDEQHRFGCDGTIYPKLEELWNTLDELDPTQGEQSVDSAISCDRNSYLVNFCPSEDGPKPVNVFTDNFIRKYDIRESICVANERVTAPDHFQDTRLLCFKSRLAIYYEPGDVCTIYPENSDENTETFLSLMKLNPNQRFKIAKRDSNYMVNYLYDFIPDGLRVEDLVRFYLDIQSVPKRSFFEHLWPFSEDPLERDKLKEFASTEGQEELYDYCIRPKRSILETLLDFPNTIERINFESLFDMIPPIKPRSFSIASACSVHPNEIHLLVGVVKYKTNMRRPRLGLCSNFLARLKPASDLSGQNDAFASKLRYFIRRSAFKLPKDVRVPILMIGPGLGIAPFRGFIEERSRLLADDATSKCDMSLYFGCRREEKDFYLRRELERYAQSGLLTLRVAFSRQANKTYVQDLLLEDSELVQRLIQQEGAIVYVAGNSKLPEELRLLFGKLLSSRTDDEAQASVEIERLVNNLETTNRIQYDCW